MVKDIGDYLSCRGYHVDTLCFCRDQPSSVRLQRGRGRILLMKELIRLRSAPFSFRYFFWMIVHAKEYDIVHIHLPNPSAILAGLLLAFFRVKMIVHWHSDIIDQKYLYKLIRPFEQMLLRRVDKIICTSDIYMKNSLPLKKWQSKCVIVPLGISDPFTSVRANDEKDDLLRKKFFSKQILFVGRLVPYKGLSHLIRAMSLLDTSFSLIIAGDGPLAEELNELILSEELSHRVHMMGEISDQQKYHLMQESGLFVLPSVTKNEAFGIVLLEAMAAGTPVISTKITGSATGVVNVNRHTGFVVEPGNIHEMAESIAEIFSEYSKYCAFSNHSREHYLTHYQTSTVNPMVEKIYQDVSVVSEGLRDV